MRILLVVLLALAVSAPATAQNKWGVNPALNIKQVTQCLGIVAAMAPHASVNLDPVINELRDRALEIGKQGERYLVYRWGYEHATAVATSIQIGRLREVSRQSVLHDLFSGLKCYVEKPDA